MKVLIAISCAFSAFLCTQAVRNSDVADEFCIAKQQQGEALGTVYEIEETCQKCACDGSLRKFCMVDPQCRDRKEAANRRPCYKGGSRFEHGSQVQVDCNICTCNNVTWSCTTQSCNYGSGMTEEAAGGAKETKCEDQDSRCEKWIKRKGKEMCEAKKYVEKKCLKSCDRCEKKAVPVVVPEVKVEVCEDTNKNCDAWSKRDGDLCTTHKFMIAKCRLSCGLCTPIIADSAPPEENNEVDEEEEVEPVREKTQQEIDEERRQAEITAWRNRLIEEGQLVDQTKTPLGCRFECGGTLYPWGSSLQDSHCGVCQCRKTGQHNYFFRCTNRECETNPTC